MKIRLKKVPLYVYPALSAGLLALSQPRCDQAWLAWFALTPLCYFMLKVKRRAAAAAGGLACGFLFYLALLYWIYPTMRAGGVEPAVSALGLLLAALLMSLEFAGISLFGHCLKKAGLKAWPYVFAAGWYLLEYGKVWVSAKAVWFPWFMLGYSQWAHLSLIQVCSVAGVYGLSAVLAFSGALAAALFARDLHWRGRALRFLPALAAADCVWGYGRAELASAPAPRAHVETALLQPSIDEYSKWDAAYAADIRARLEDELSAARGAELVVWPENALPCWINEPACYGWLKNAVAISSGTSLVGSVSKGDGRRVSAFLVNPAGEITASYDKRQLVPFGEYVPMRDLLGSFIRPVAALGEFEPGRPDQRLMDMRGLKLGAAICYESVFPYLFSGDTLAGADLFVNITNDGWYLDTAAPYQHFTANIFRAVENRRTLVRAANNGISGVIDPWGRVLVRTALDQVTVVRYSVPLYPARALFPEYGRWIAGGMLTVVCPFLVAVLFL